MTDGEIECGFNALFDEKFRDKVICRLKFLEVENQWIPCSMIHLLCDFTEHSMWNPLFVIKFLIKHLTLHNIINVFSHYGAGDKAAYKSI